MTVGEFDLVSVQVGEIRGELEIADEFHAGIDGSIVHFQELEVVDFGFQNSEGDFLGKRLREFKERTEHDHIDGFGGS